MYIPNPVPTDGHYAYIFKARGRDWFKIGISRDVDNRLRGLQSRSQRWEPYRDWFFENYFAALYVEQTTIAYLKLFEFNPVSETNEFFEISESNMNVVAGIVEELAQQILTWEAANFGLNRYPANGTPYEKCLYAERQKAVAEFRKRRRG